MEEGKYAELIQRMKDRVMNELPLSQLNNDQLKSSIEGMVFTELAGQYISVPDKVEIVRQIYSSIRGFDILDSIMSDSSITEVMINGPRDIFVEKGSKVVKLDKCFDNERRLLDVIQRIVGMAGREVTEANPIVDARLPDGSRVNVVLSPVSLVGPVVTIRKFSKDPMTMEKLIGYGSLTREVADVLETLVKARYNIFVSGGTGSGKTTFLNALSNFIPKDERIITIEDSAELQIKNVPNLVRMEVRNANSAGVGSIPMKDLIKSSLRMRPDRIIVGEVRGEEALDMLQAMNTGHDGSLSTGHANSAQDMISRLETMVLQGSSALPLKAVRQQISSAVDIIIHLSRMRDHSRKTLMITEVLGMDEQDNVILNPLYEFREDENSTLEHVSGVLTRTENKMVNVFKLQLSGFSTDI